MKKVELKSTDIDMYDRDSAGQIVIAGKMSYKHLIDQALRFTKTGRFFEEQIDQRLRIMRFLSDKEDGDVVDMEDNDVNVLKRCVIEYDGNWPILHEDTSKFVKYIKGL